MVVAPIPAASIPDPAQEENIRRLLELFYDRVRRDPQLGPVFAHAVGTTAAEWAPHLARLADFWSSVMLRSGRYHGNPYAVHLRLPDLEPAMFDRWLALFGASCADVLEPDLALTFRERAARIAQSLRSGLFGRLPVARGQGDTLRSDGMPDAGKPS